MQAPQFDVLVLVTGSTELKSVRDEARVRGRAGDVVRSEVGPYLNLGEFGGDRVGAFELKIRHAAGVAYDCHRALADTTATTLLLVGTAFGVDETRQQIADVLVVTGVRAYDHGDVRDVAAEEDPSETYRYHYAEIGNTSAACTDAWVARCRDFSKTRGPLIDARPAHVGTLLSGGARIASGAFRDHLVRRVPERDVVGGEMVASGLAATCERTGAEWFIIKAISDFATVESREDVKAAREAAARSSAAFALDVLDWRRDA